MIKLKSSEKAITAHAESIDLWIVGYSSHIIFVSIFGYN